MGTTLAIEEIPGVIEFHNHTSATYDDWSCTTRKMKRLAQQLLQGLGIEPLTGDTRFQQGVVMLPADLTNARSLYVSTHIGRPNYPSDPRQDQTDLNISASGSLLLGGVHIRQVSEVIGPRQ